MIAWSIFSGAIPDVKVPQTHGPLPMFTSNNAPLLLSRRSMQVQSLFDMVDMKPGSVERSPETQLPSVSGGPTLLAGGAMALTDPSSNKLAEEGHMGAGEEIAIQRLTDSTPDGLDRKFGNRLDTLYSCPITNSTSFNPLPPFFRPYTTGWLNIGS